MQLALFEAFEAPLVSLLARYGLPVVVEPADASIPGSYWGESEAGLTRSGLHVRADTPVHSALHEACHWICMTPDRRAMIDTDAGGTDLEECGVCYLQILLADALPGIGRDRLMADMDAWGYSFRLGNTRSWFDADAADAREVLERWGLIDGDDRPVLGVVRGPD